MKRLVFAVFILLISFSGWAAEYKGFAELQSGLMRTRPVYGTSMGLSTSHGAMISENYFVGGGFDFGTLYSPSNDYSYGSMFLDGRYYLKPEEKITPVFGLRVGPHWNSLEESTYFSFNPFVGIDFNVSRSFGFCVNLGYKLAFIPGGYYDHIAISQPENRITAPTVNCLVLGLGIHF